MTRLINIGFNNTIPLDRVLVILKPESAPIKRYIAEVKKSNMVIDATYGRRTRSVIVLDTGHLVMSSVQPETVSNRANNKPLADE